MALTRTVHWATRELPAFLQKRMLDANFIWGTNDCCLIAADEIQAITGVDVAGDFRGKYDDEASAFALIHAVTGGTTVADAAAHCATKFGLAEWPYPRLAQRGDLVVIDDAGQLIVGFIHPNGRFAVSMGANGLRLIPMAQVVRAWRV